MVMLGALIVGMGIIVSGAYYIKNIGDRLYESTELMNRYLGGDAAAGEMLKIRGAVHVATVGTLHFGSKLLAKPVGALVNKIHLEEKVGSYVASAFANTPGGYGQAVEILNRISPKYTAALTGLIDKYGSKIASEVADVYESQGIGEVQKFIESEQLFDELTQNGVKFSKENTLWVTKLDDGRIVWLEVGSGGDRGAGLTHILEGHLNATHNDFAIFGVNSEKELVNFLHNTVSQQVPVQINSGGEYVYLVENRYLKIIIGSNGFIVSAYPTG